ncbi:MAG: DNRLRE domain-containing protein [Ardenticatenaceae bacterium]|nr:DNRLRE domain-containing protein [Ardenticatenaceae bacterium]
MNKKRATFLISVILVLGIIGWSGSRLTAPPPAAAAPLANSMTLLPVADAMIWEQFPDTNYGSTTGLFLDSDEFNFLSRSLIRYDLSAIPAGSTIIEATLSLYQTQQDSAPNLQMDLERVTATWAENAVTWNNRPATAPCCEATSINNPPTQRRFVFDITTTVDRWVNQSAAFPNYGVYLTTSSSDTYYILGFGSREYDADKRPDLVIHYIPPNNDAVKIVSAEADATITRNGADTNYGSLSELAIGSSEFYDYEFLLRFDLDDLGPGAEIESAVLLLDLATDQSTQDTDMEAVRVAKSWAENTVTYNNRPTTTDVVGTGQVEQTVDRKFAIDVTSAVQAWVSDPTTPNHGLLVRHSGLTGLNSFSFSSREGADAPLLVVRYRQRVFLPITLR